MIRSHSVVKEGSADILERVAAGTYIMEELEAPEGFAKALPMGISVEETARTPDSDHGR